MFSGCDRIGFETGAKGDAVGDHNSVNFQPKAISGVLMIFNSRESSSVSLQLNRDLFSG